MTIRQLKTLTDGILANHSLQKVDINFDDLGIMGIICQNRIERHLKGLELDPSITNLEEALMTDLLALEEERSVEPILNYSKLSFFTATRGQAKDNTLNTNVARISAA